MSDNFAVFILSHGRPENVLSYNTLKKQGYTGKIFIVIDDQDKQIDGYKNKFGDSVLIFNKDEALRNFDIADNFGNKNVVVYARNVCFDFAKQLAVEYFAMFDDDYTSFRFTHDGEGRYITKRLKPKNLDNIFGYMVDFCVRTGCLSLAMGQGGDFIGGQNSGLFKNKIKRKCMNSWILCTKKPFSFIGSLNEDVNTYISLGITGSLFFTISDLRLEQAATQQAKGGMTEVYLSQGTYTKSFYALMMSPSSVKISVIGSHNRLHHRIDWNKTVPKIIEEKHKK